MLITGNHVMAVCHDKVHGTSNNSKQKRTIVLSRDSMHQLTKQKGKLLTG